MEVRIQIIDDEGKTYLGKLILGKGKQNDKKTRLITTSHRKGKLIKLPDVIRDKLYRVNFFRTYKTFPQVENKLSDMDYHFKKNSIFMALKSANYLIKIGKRGNYKFVQKYPQQA